MRQVRVWGALILLLAVTLRLYGLDWDAGGRFHPDERLILSVAETRPATPYTRTDVRYPYGQLPLWLLAGLAPLLPEGLARPFAGDTFLATARMLAALADTATVVLVGGLAFALYGAPSALLSMALVGLAVLHIQQAHFYTADILLAPIWVAATWALVCLARSPAGTRARYALTAGALIGLAMSAKITGALLLPALVIAHLAPGWQNSAGTWRARWRSAWTDDAWGWFAPSLGAALGVFALVNPSVWQAFPAVRAAWHAEVAMVWGRIVPPYTRQFLDATPILYPITQHMQWFLGPTAALLAWGGTLWALWRAVRRRLAVGEVIVLAALLPAMGVILSAFAQFPRYWLPLFPLMALLGSGWLVRAAPRHWQPGVAMFGITPTLLYALAFVSLYKDAHPWWLASAWLCENMPQGAVLLVETWDQPLPVAGACDGRFVIITGDPYTPEGVAALPRLAEQADAIVLSSPRSWQTHARQSAHFPEVAAFYRSLFAGNQFEVAAVWRPEPSLGGVALSANLFTAAHVPTPSAWEASAPRRRIQLGRYDESFAVYDHPVVLILTRR